MAIRVVVDSNMLGSPQLRKFLESDQTNFAVMTDYAWMEAYKSKSILIIQKSLSVIGDYPEQIVLLKGTKAITALDYRSAGIASQMEWRGARSDFAESVTKIRSLDAQRDAHWFARNENTVAAIEHVEGRLLSDISSFTQTFSELEGLFSKDEIAHIRSRRPISVEIARKIFGIADTTAKTIAKRHPAKPAGVSFKSRVNSFLFRYSLSGSLNLMEWIRNGSPDNVKDTKMRNDLVDLVFATYGTYFNGVLSSDRKLLDRHNEMRVVLGILGARMPADWNDLICD